MTFTWNNQQQEALDALDAYVAGSNRGAFVLAGLAGTGKTTLISAFIESVLSRGVALLAPTGRAAAVLNSKQSFVQARTIHSFLYGAAHDPNANLIERIEQIETALDKGELNSIETNQLKEELQELSDRAGRAFNGKDELQFTMKDPAQILAEGVSLIIVDEASMVAPDEVKNLASLGLPTIYLGDPNQLFPVGHKRFAVALDHPDALLTQIMRQGDGSPILELSRDIIASKGLPRNIKNIPTSNGTNPLLFLEKFDGEAQCIVFKNATRRALNVTIRNALHGDKVDPVRPYLPFVGEKLMIDANRREFGLMKGDIITVDRITQYSANGVVDKFICDVEFTDRRGIKKTVPLYLNDLMLSVGHELGQEKPAYGDKDAFQDFKYNFIASKRSVACMFPYAITCHKSQGSEWPNVILYNEGPRDQKAQFLYTGVTRASENLVLMGVY